MKEKSFFVNLKSESSNALAYKVGLMVEELKARTTKKGRVGEPNYTPAIDKPKKEMISKEEIELKIKKWAENKNLKISKCLTIMKQYKWSLTVNQWKKIMKDSLLVANPSLFLVGLTKEPYKRTWTNSKGELKKAADYGNVLLVKDDHVMLNKDYEKSIKLYW